MHFQQPEWRRALRAPILQLPDHLPLKLILSVGTASSAGGGVDAWTGRLLGWMDKHLRSAHLGELGADLLNLDRNVADQLHFDFCVVDFYVGVVWIIRKNTNVETVRVVG